MANMHSSTVVIGQNLGQDSDFREKFDVAVARAVAEMRVLGNYDMITSYIEILFSFYFSKTASFFII